MLLNDYNFTKLYNLIMNKENKIDLNSPFISGNEKSI